jgi:predicted Zn-dependent protease
MSMMTSPAPAAAGLDFLFHKWRARLQLFLGLKESAVESFEQMRQRWPLDVYPLESLAHLAAADGHPARAATLLRRVTEMQPERAAGWFNLAFVLEQAGEPVQAESAFRRAIELDPQIDRAWYGLGLCLIQQGRLTEALEALERNTKMQPMSPFGWYQMARVHADLGNRKEAARVIKHLEGFEPKVAAQLRRETGIGRSQEPQ